MTIIMYSFTCTDSTVKNTDDMKPNNPTRFIKQKLDTRAYKKIKELEISQEIFCDFFVRLYALFGDAEVNYEGFSYDIYDQENNFSFGASLGGFGAGYYIQDEEKDTTKALQIITDFEEVLYSKSLELKPCSVTFEHDFGTTTYTYQDGKCVSSHEYDE